MSIQSIATQYTLPVAIRSAPGFRGSNRPIILHSVSRMSFAFGRALRDNPSEGNTDRRYRPLESEIVAVPLAYPGRRGIFTLAFIRLRLFRILRMFAF